MALVVFSIDRDKLPEHTDEQFEEWIKFHVGQIKNITAKNPLWCVDLEAEVKEVG